MNNLLERSFFLTLGAAALTKEVAEGVVSELVKRGQITSDEGRKTVDEVVEQAKNETRGLRTRIDEAMQRNLQDLGLAPREQVEDLQLKIAQLEHRISLLETAQEKPAEPVVEEGRGKSKKKKS